MQYSNHDNSVHTFSCKANNKMLKTLTLIVSSNPTPAQSHLPKCLLMNDRQSNLDSVHPLAPGLHHLPLLSSLSSRLVHSVAAVYLVGTTSSGVTQVHGLCLLLSQSQMPDSKVSRRQDSPSNAFAALVARVVGLDNIIVVVSIPLGIQGSKT